MSEAAIYRAWKTIIGNIARTVNGTWSSAESAAITAVTAATATSKTGRNVPAAHRHMTYKTGAAQVIWPTDTPGIVLMILSTEGGYVNNPSDRGGPTNMGVTIDTLASFRKAPVTATDIQNLTVQEASALYLQKYIIGPGFDQLTDIRLRTAMVDYGVLCGPIMATKSLQNHVWRATDGICGPGTLASANAVTDTRGLINSLSGDRITFHCGRIVKDPTQAQFLLGWITRALSFIE